MNVSFLEQEHLIRTRWLRVFIATILINLGCAACKAPYLLPANLDPSMRPFFNVILGISLCLGMAFNYALFHFAYKKRGTKLLTFSLGLSWVSIITIIVLTLGTLLSIALRRPVEFSLFYNTHSLVERIFTLASHLFGLVFYLFSVRLRRLNKANKLRELREQTAAI